jgi:L-serine dehydratase
MAAAAVVQMRGGTPDMIGDVISLTLMNCMGLICDPVAGLVQVLCAQRNASQAVNAITSADMILGGMTIPIPADEVIGAMYNVGRQLPVELKETALGGIAATPTGKHIREEIFK